MLDFEYLQCDLTLRSARGDNTAFFAFADTVVAKVPSATPILPVCCSRCKAADWRLYCLAGLQSEQRMPRMAGHQVPEQPQATLNYALCADCCTFCPPVSLLQPKLCAFSRTKPNQVLIHVRMLDKTAQAQVMPITRPIAGSLPC